MVYTTMTRGKVLRLIARGWDPSDLLMEHLNDPQFDYFEVAFHLAGWYRGIVGRGYLPEVEEGLIMKYHGKIQVRRFAENNWNPEITKIYDECFQAKSIQSAKAKLTKIANETDLFSWVQSWDNETRAYTGKDLRWRSWTTPDPYKQEDGVEVAWATRVSERESGEQIYPEDYDTYGKNVGYVVDLILRWTDEF